MTNETLIEIVKLFRSLGDNAPWIAGIIGIVTVVCLAVWIGNNGERAKFIRDSFKRIFNSLDDIGELTDSAIADNKETGEHADNALNVIKDSKTGVKSALDIIRRLRKKQNP